MKPSSLCNYYVPKVLYIEHWAFACVTTRHIHAVSYSYAYKTRYCGNQERVAEEGLVMK